MPIKILFKHDGKEGKTKGALMPEEENDIPQIVGLSKMQFFGFLLATLLMGAGIFGIGYTLAYVNKPKEQERTAKIGDDKKKKFKQVVKAIEHEYSNETISKILNIDINENVEQTEEKKQYVTLGLYKTEEEAQKLIPTLSKLGKTGHIKKTDHGYILYLGPYDSLSLAQNEIDSISMASSLNGSIINTLG